VVIFPIIAAAVSAVFAMLLLLQYAHRHGLAQLMWGVALAMFAVASLVAAAGVGGGWDPTLFRLYWLFGAMLNVPYLALGSVALLRNRALTGLMAVLVAIGTVLALGAVLTAHANPAAFGPDPKQIPRGSAVWGKDALLHNLPDWYSIPAYLIVVAIAVASSRPSRASRLPPGRARGNWLIAGGVTFVAVGSSTARYGHGAVFGIFLALGVVVMFVGFMFASRRSSVENP
jgi:hypothetical protein